MPTPRTDPFLDSVAFRERIMEYRHLADDRRVELLLLCAMLHRLERLEEMILQKRKDGQAD